MRVLLINVSSGTGSTGRICEEIARAFISRGDEALIAYGRSINEERSKDISIRVGNDADVYFHAAMTRLFDCTGFCSYRATKRFLKKMDEYDPDILWLHNIHGYYIHVGLLFEWIKSRPNMEVRWTLHDCWAFTGHCSYFATVKCEQWKSHCSYCVQKTSYPASMLMDRSKQNYDRKRAAFTGVKNMTLITPSKWLADLVKQSFLKEYPVRVRYNSIDTSVFKPTPSDFRERYSLTDKKIVLGVASVWNERKGLDDFVKLAGMLDERFAIVLVGLSEKQLKEVPKRIIGIRRTNSAKELAEIYTAADVFVNPTYEDNYPTVILEAEACGTRVVTYDTGGCREGIKREDSAVIAVGDIEQIKQECSA